jgi:hypothetical protein
MIFMLLYHTKTSSMTRFAFDNMWYSKEDTEIPRFNEEEKLSGFNTHSL